MLTKGERMFIILIFASFANLAQLQYKYNYCKSVGFEPEYCSVQKELNKFENKK